MPPTLIRLPALACLAALALASCAPPPARYVVPPAPVAEARIAIPYASVAVRQVSLPTYAASEEIHVLTPEGAVKSSPGLLWADDPIRAMTQDIARDIGRMTRVRVAAEPWPFGGRAEAVVEIRISDMLAVMGGPFRLRGQYFVAPDTGRRDRGASFDIAIPLPAEAGPAEIAAARGQAVRDLARQIVREGLR